MIRIRANIMLALSATLASALLLTAAQGVTVASASSMPPPKPLTGEGRWQSTDDVHTQDSIAVADDATTASVISMWRSNTPGDNSIAWQVVQNDRVYPIQGAAAVSENAPSLVAAGGWVFAFHRGLQNQIWWARAHLGTPTTDGNFTLTAWQQIPNVTTSATPVVTQVGSNFLVAYRGLTNTGIYTASTTFAGLVGGDPTWNNTGPVNAGTLYAPGLTTLEGQPILVYNRAGHLYMRRRTGLNGPWGPERQMTDSNVPVVMGRPSVAASGNMMDIVTLGLPRTQGGLYLYRNSYALNLLDQINPVSGWTSDRERYHTASPTTLWAVTTAFAYVIYIALRGLNNGLVYVKELNQKNR
jgi:hypothetical protein